MSNLLEAYPQIAEAEARHTQNGWPSQEMQTKCLSVIWQLMQSLPSLITVLDVGCGDGEFFKYMGDRINHSNYRYVGIDIRPDIIEKATARFGSLQNVRFVVGDILDYVPERDFDYVVASGLFDKGYGSMGVDWDAEGIFSRVDQMVKIAKRATIFNARPSVEPMTDLYHHLRVMFRLPMKILADYLNDNYTFYVNSRWP